MSVLPILTSFLPLGMEMHDSASAARQTMSYLPLGMEYHQSVSYQWKPRSDSSSTALSSSSEDASAVDGTQFLRLGMAVKGEADWYETAVDDDNSSK